MPCRKTFLDGAEPALLSLKRLLEQFLVPKRFLVQKRFGLKNHRLCRVYLVYLVYFVYVLLVFYEHSFFWGPKVLVTLSSKRAAPGKPPCDRVG